MILSYAFLVLCGIVQKNDPGMDKVTPQADYVCALEYRVYAIYKEGRIPPPPKVVECVDEMRPLQKRGNCSTEPSLRSGNETLRCNERTDLILDDIRGVSELDELQVAHIKQEKDTAAALIDLLESGSHRGKTIQQKIARAREPLARIDELLAFGLKHGLTQH